MNKNTKVARNEFDNEKQRVVGIVEIYNLEYAPLECFENEVIVPITVTECIEYHYYEHELCN